MSASSAPPQDEVSPDAVQTPAKRRGADTRALLTTPEYHI